MISTANLLEVQLVVLGSRSPIGWASVEDLIEKYAIAIQPFDLRGRWRSLT